MLPIWRLQVPRVAGFKNALRKTLKRGILFFYSIGEIILDKVFHFRSPRENYVCDAAVIWCFDHRFDVVFRNFLERIYVMNPDVIKIAGGSKCLASPGNDVERDFILNQIRTSMRLHATKRVLLMAHSDCGAYGGLAAFGNDAQREADHRQRELAQATKNLLTAIPGLEVRSYFMDFEGVYDAQVSRGARSQAD